MNKEQNKEARKLPGFYIALCCCVLVIGIAGYFTERYNDSDTENVMNTETISEDGSDLATDSTTFTDDLDTYTEPVLSEETPAEEEADNNTQASEGIPVVSEPLSDAPVEEYAVDNPDVEETAVIVSSEQPAFIMPVSGKIIGEYSDKLVYNNALDDWRTHDGVDIAADTGCSVQAVSSGVVDEISEDAMGGYVVISHAAGFVTKYMGLENVENLTVGKEIMSGEVIGTAGVCAGENATEPHIHFEMTKDGKTVNPTDYLPH